MIQAKIDPKYEIVRKLREGGMGAIFLVRHRLLDELRRNPKKYFQVNVMDF